MPALTTRDFDVTEADIATVRSALTSGEITAVTLVNEYLRRIAHYDRSGIRLNAVVELNPEMFDEARASDERRRRGRVLSPLDGITFTAKACYMVRGMPLTAGSPAFAQLIAQDDAYVIARLRAAGAIVIGLTNMPPMAFGGMQRGLYGRAESPYHRDFLTAAYASGSSNGSGTATAASFATFGLGEETWSSGRTPASNNALVAYTPSRGLISVRGSWPLTPTMDVAVPHTRSVTDLCEVLDIVIADDPDTRGDFWRAQPWVALPAPSQERPPSYVSALKKSSGVRGRRLGAPRMYVNADSESRRPVDTHPDVIAAWERACADLRRLGAEVVEVDFPAVSNYERDRPGACGHNVIAAISTGAALALAPYVDDLGITLSVLGTPAEEGGGGKIEMLDRGGFDGVHAAAMVHPGPVDVARAQPFAVSHSHIRYEGKSAHAAAYPDRGINAADAFTIAQVAIGLLRQQFPHDVRVHGLMTNGGEAPNAIPQRTEGRWYVRAGTLADLADMERRVNRCFEAGAHATGCELTITPESKPYAEFRTDEGLLDTYVRRAEQVGRQFSAGSDALMNRASTDMGNVSQRIPAIHPYIGIDSLPAVNHQREFADAAASPAADRATVEGARALALTLFDAASDAATRQRLLDTAERYRP